jgi:integrase
MYGCCFTVGAGSIALTHAEYADYEWWDPPYIFGVTPITGHCLCDTHPSLVSKKGVPIEVVSKRLGHADIRVTSERYLHVYRDRDAAAASALDTLCG